MDWGTPNVHLVVGIISGDSLRANCSSHNDGLRMGFILMSDLRPWIDDVIRRSMGWSLMKPSAEPQITTMRIWWPVSLTHFGHQIDGSYRNFFCVLAERCIGHAFFWACRSKLLIWDSPFWMPRSDSNHGSYVSWNLLSCPNKPRGGSCSVWEHVTWSFTTTYLRLDGEDGGLHLRIAYLRLYVKRRRHFDSAHSLMKLGDNICK